MQKVLKVVSLILLLCFAYQVLAIQTQINKVTDLFDKHIENKNNLLLDMKKQSDNAHDLIKSGQHHDAIVGIGESANKASEINSIGESDLENAGRSKRISNEYQFYDENELEPDYTKPGNRMHKLDAEDIVDATEKTIRNVGIDLMKKLIELGFNCKTVKGVIYKEPTYYIEIKKEEQKNTEYDQFFCEEPRNQYNCNDSVSLSCAKTGLRYGQWQHKTIKLPGHALHNEKMHWGYAVKWKYKRWGWHITPYHPKGWGEYQIDSLWRNNPELIIADARIYLANKLGVQLEQIREDVGFPPGGRGVDDGSSIDPVGCRWRVAWNEYEFTYYYRDTYPVCEVWAEDWTETCGLK